jgi:hypothetical protein
MHISLFGLFAPFLGFVSIFLIDLHRRRFRLSALLRMPLLASLDLLPPALIGSVAIGLIASLYPTVQTLGMLPVRTPAFLTLLLCLICFPLFWREGRKQIQFQRPIGLLFAEWLIFAAVVRTFLAVMFNSQAGQLSRTLLYTVPLLVVGSGLVIVVVLPFVRKYEGLRILERVASDKQFPQPEYTPPTFECPQPELWKMLDSQVPR